MPSNATGRTKLVAASVAAAAALAAGAASASAEPPTLVLDAPEVEHVATNIVSATATIDHCTPTGLDAYARMRKVPKHFPLALQITPAPRVGTTVHELHFVLPPKAVRALHRHRRGRAVVTVRCRDDGAHLITATRTIGLRRPLPGIPGPAERP